MMASAGRAQTLPPTTIHGRVLADETGDPLRNARVGGAAADAVPVVTDADGHEVEYYCYDRIQFGVPLDDADFNPDVLWPSASSSSNRVPRLSN